MLRDTRRVSSCVVVVLLALGAVHTPRTAVAQESLYDRLGGVYNIAAVVDDVVERILVNEILEANPAVKMAHDRVPKAGLKFQVTALVCQASGGPSTYAGRDMKTVHASLNITQGEWDELMTIFKVTFDTFEVPEQEQAELFAIIAATKDDIVTGP